MIEGVRSVIYVKPRSFNSANNARIVPVINRLNAEFAAKGEGYVLIGPGRWGSSDNALGIPVRWADISAARVIVEAALGNYRIEPSQGTHFFQNLTSFGVGYFTVDHGAKNGFYDSEYLDACPAVYEDDYVRVVTFGQPLGIAINGRSGLGSILKPEYNITDSVSQHPDLP